MRHLALCIALLACRRRDVPRPAPPPATPRPLAPAADAAPAPVPPDATAPAPDAATPAAPPTSVEGPCAPVAAQARTAIAAAAARADGGAVDPDPHLGRCYRTPGGGAWALALEALRYVPSEDGVAGRWALVHVDAAGRRALVRPGIPGGPYFTGGDNYVADGTSAVDFGDPTLFDYDGDGDPELVLPHGHKGREGPYHDATRVWTARGGAVRPYAPASSFEVGAARDVDGDGRPDLVTSAPYLGASLECASSFERIVTGPALVAHSRPDGTFSLDDDVAVAFARASCPARPTALVARPGDPGSVDADATAVNVACARLWGAATDDVLRRLRAECPAPAGQGDRPCAACSDQDVLEHWAALPPPLRLDAPPRATVASP